ncbi:MAG: cobalamin biosynthesis protein CbiX [Candidatus Thiodiazotropha sp. (ex Epidulcina cf. delphinae)]|nr:cobalamin biosynthesis protein CbiX [Candidatus Thiodiazotropha sp. (ex Epidulcina cf. delphinae)]
MKRPTLLLLDNGSSRAEATRYLRRLAGELSHLSGQKVYPVSLQHADRIPVHRLAGRAADTFAPFLRRKLADGKREFLAVPLFFGVGRALTSFIPDQVSSLQAEFGAFSLRLADVLYPLPTGEPRLAKILCDQFSDMLHETQVQRVILVDHGSPLPSVTEVRRRVAEQMRDMLPPGVGLEEAVMERRNSPEYDFNGELLEPLLERTVPTAREIPIILSLLFLSPGRHAGDNGDIARICADAQQRHPGLNIRISRLVGDHPGLVDILYDRLMTGLENTEQRMPTHSIQGERP